MSSTPYGLARPWLPVGANKRESEIRAGLNGLDLDSLDRKLHQATARNREIHEQECINLNPATNIMNPRAEALLSSGLGSRPSLGHPGEKYEMGLEAIEEIEVMAAELACRVFAAAFAEIRVGSGALANLYGFMATCQPGDAVIVPPPSIGGHVTHNTSGVAGLYGVQVHEAPIDPATYTVDVAGVAELAKRVKPKLITIGSSLNLSHHPVSELRAIADQVGAYLLFDAAHLCGLIAGQAWPNPLEQGAHMMTMSTYKSLGGPAGGLLVTSDVALAEKIDAIAYPGLTANFDVAKSASLALTLLDWVEFGVDYAAAMIANAATLAEELGQRNVPLYVVDPTSAAPSHQFVVDATAIGGGHSAAQKLRKANLLACAIGLPTGPGDGLRLGTPEITRIGMTEEDMAPLASLVAAAINGNESELGGLARNVAEMRGKFRTLRFVR